MRGITHLKIRASSLFVPLFLPATEGTVIWNDCLGPHTPLVKLNAWDVVTEAEGAPPVPKYCTISKAAGVAPIFDLLSKETVSNSPENNSTFGIVFSRAASVTAVPIADNWYSKYRVAFALGSKGNPVPILVTAVKRIVSVTPVPPCFLKDHPDKTPEEVVETYSPVEFLKNPEPGAIWVLPIGTGVIAESVSLTASINKNCPLCRRDVIF